MAKKILLFLLILPTLLMANSESPLDKYIAEGLQSNLALRQEEFNLERSLAALKEARGLFLPNVSIQARYTRAGGGRLIEVPIGDLVNPIYVSLNTLFQFHGLDPLFPSNLPNEVFPFLREKEHETKLRIVQPLFRPEIRHNIRLKSSLSKIQEAQVAVFKRRLIADIKIAYYNYAKTVRIMELFDQTQALLEENIRVSENLFDNGKATEDIIFRAKAELADLAQKRAEAEKNRHSAAAYFNFLINRDLDESIILDVQSFQPLIQSPDLKEAVRNALSHRREFSQMQSALDAASSQEGIAKSQYFPSVTAVVDYGFQGEKYQFSSEDDYWMASLVFEWNLFNGSQTSARKAQAAIEKKRLEVKMQELEKQITLQVQDTFYALEAARMAVLAAKEKEKAAQKSFDIVTKKFEFGTAPQIEYIDARTTLTGASVNHIISRAEYFIKQAAFERSAAISDLKKYDH